MATVRLGTAMNEGGRAWRGGLGLRGLVGLLAAGLFAGACGTTTVVETCDLSGNTPDPSPEVVGAEVLEIASVPDAEVALPELPQYDFEMPGSEIVPGEFSAPCVDNNSCISGWCVPWDEGYVCTRTCVDSCPEGWECRAVQNTWPDAVFVCFPEKSHLCQPCSTDLQCGNGYCLPEADGLACTRPCETKIDCPEGYDCEPRQSLEDPLRQGNQCVPVTGRCDCTALNDGEERPCLEENEFGRCWGSEVCDGEVGWSVCSALVPAAEACDGQDNDCDGFADENVVQPDEECAVSNEAGRCSGVWICRGAAGFECTAPTPVAELCDYQDNDCDERVDEDFVDETGRYVAESDCGVCGNACAGLFPHATSACDASGDEPQCAVAACDPGYFRANAYTCLPLTTSLCLACNSDENCVVPGDRCLALGSGHYCGRDCSANSVHGQECPAGYSCQAVPEGGEQCVPETGSCDCLPENAGLERSCAVTNAIGTCLGFETCTVDGGWSPCTAAEAAPEVCDGVDNDCDGLLDDDVAEPVESCQTEWTDPAGGTAICTGDWSCRAVAGVTDWVCLAPQAGAEVCDYQDNDCDGSTDEDFKLEGTDKYADLDNCGVCGYSCAGVLPNATARCDGTLPTPACVVESCDPGYYQVGSTTCLPVRDPSCEPCSQDANCLVPGNRCLDLDGGQFCGRDCGPQNLYGTPEGECPDGFLCLEQAGGTLQCVPTTASCTCYLEGQAGDSRSCIRSNAEGTCTGLQTCDPDANGWSACDALVPAPEQCNGVDDNCNGFLDENVSAPADACANENAFGRCTAEWHCAGGDGWLCPAAEPAAETCDYADNDCDGAVDEAFRDGDTGLYNDFDHCGVCNNTCAGAILFATETACDASGPTAVCTAVACEDGYFIPPGNNRVCVPIAGASDCSPCSEDAHCDTLPGGLCESIDQGRFCTRSCATVADCPDSYDCAGGRCRPHSQSCTCLPPNDDAVRVCFVSNPAGTCSGTQRCDAESVPGWSVCTARVPAVEGCDGLDNNCNGLTDEGVTHTPPECASTNEWGTCDGRFVCGGTASWTCTAATPAAEACDYADNDCDEAVDEPFRDAATGRYNSINHCGVCNYSCAGQVEHAATMQCDITKPTPTCIVGTCEVGYFRANDFSCVAVTDNRCDVCQTDDNCPVPGDRCLLLDGQRVCGYDCAARNLHGTPEGQCPAGFVCQGQTGDAVRQCVPVSGSCACLADDSGDTRFCSRSNAFGTCTGSETCNPAAGWQNCSARTPAGETCNGVDDDCNGAADDGVTAPTTPCRNQNVHGTCNGSWVCGPQGGSVRWWCNAAVPAADACDYADNDCDGRADEDFKDPTSGLYVDDENCGACGVTCSGVIPNATAQCVAADGVARCEVAACDAGYYPAGPLTCLPVSDDSCAPCQTDANCPTPGDLCLDLDGGRFCGRDCAADNLHGTPAGACPAGYECVDLGAGVSQCEPTSGSCTCLVSDGGDTRTCVRTGEFGTCYGQETCNPASGWAGCTARTPAQEICNAIDDDCDSAIDDVTGRGVACTIQNAHGSCPGVRDCVTGQTTLQCVGRTPAAETCNYIDDDCDSGTDETFADLYQSCSAGEGQCRRFGFRTCRTDGTGTQCNAQAGTGVDEICDGLDNDCDAATDETWPLKGQVCTVGSGVCQRAGVWVCATGGAGLVCSATAGSPDPGGEICDGLDNNCNGQVDDGLTAPNCDLTQGVCGGKRKTCGGALGWLACTAATYGTTYEATELTCDGLDNDCDGSVDEQLAAQPCTLQQGVCAGATRRCVSGQWQTCGATEYGTNYEVTESRCDGLDNDCDGQIDEALQGLQCTTQAGVCAGSREVCQGTAGWTHPCTPAVYTGHSTYYEATEISCDGRDNDCDGQVDDSLPAQPCLLQQGVCAGTAKRCASGAWQTCTAGDYGTNYEASETRCDGLDNDCDGQIDEGLQGLQCTTQAGVCAGSREVCQGTAGWTHPCSASVYTAHSAYYEPTEISCDGRDNDCDGLVDESLPAQPCLLQQGVCAGTVKRCASGAWQTCTAGDYGTNYEASETRCDGLDNDCDGQIDEGLQGLQCTTQAGVCAGSRETCRGTSGWAHPCDTAVYAAFSAYYEPTEATCDGRDNDCDGQVDESLIGPLCTLSAGVCAGARQTCSGSWQACTATVYETYSGGAYESDETSCDLLDNDCDGSTDEGYLNGGKYDRNDACGNCFTDCTEIYAKANAHGVCNATGVPVCEMRCCRAGDSNPACDGGAGSFNYYDLNAVPGDGCEFRLDATAIYVSETDAAGNDLPGCGRGPVGTGTGNRPCLTIARGIAEAQGAGRTKVLVADGLYEETVTLVNGISLLGGYRSDTWERHLSSTMTIVRGTATGTHRNTLIATNITSATVLQGFVVYGQQNATAGGNSYALYVSGSDADLQVRDNVFYAGSGGPGSNRPAGAAGQAGVDGAGRDPNNPAPYDVIQTTGAPCDSSYNRQYGNGGVRSCGSDDVGGGNGGGNRCAPVASTEYSGLDGSSGQAGDGTSGGGAGTGGDAGDDGGLRYSGGFVCGLPSSPMVGAVGTNGVNALHGAGGAGCSAAAGSVSSGHWLGGTSANGTSGGNGGGGGGGGAGGGGDSDLTWAGYYDRLGGHGGGGGSGGCGGTGAQGGGAGGGSFAVFILGGTAPVIQNNTVFQGLGGGGGDGGTGGVAGTGGRGGNGGLCTDSCWCYASAGKGGEGGNGGHGGGGGGGCGGASFGIYTSGVGGSPNYCAGGNGNTFSGGAGGAGGAGGLSLGQSGTAGAAGVLETCSYH